MAPISSTLPIVTSITMNAQPFTPIVTARPKAAAVHLILDCRAALAMTGQLIKNSK